MAVQNFRMQRSNILCGLAGVTLAVTALLIAFPVFAQSQQQISKCSRLSFITPQIAYMATGNPNANPTDVLGALYAAAQVTGTSRAAYAQGILRLMADQRQDCLDSLR